ncbi:MAG: ABC transporter permease [bacterium]
MMIPLQKIVYLVIADLKPLIRERKIIVLLLVFPFILNLIFGAMINIYNREASYSTCYLLALPIAIITVALFNCFRRGSQTIVTQRENGILERVLLSPTHPVVIVISKILFLEIVAVMQITVLFTISVFFGFKVSNLPNIVPIILLFTLMLSGFSIFYSNLIKTEDAAEYASMLIIFPLLILGGVWVPLDAMPPIAKTIAKFTPSFYGMDALQLLMYGEGLTKVVVHIIILGILAFLFSFIGMLQFKWEKKRR